MQMRTSSGICGPCTQHIVGKPTLAQPCSHKAQCNLGVDSVNLFVYSGELGTGSLGHGQVGVEGAGGQNTPNFQERGRDRGWH